MKRAAKQATRAVHAALEAALPGAVTDQLGVLYGVALSKLEVVRAVDPVFAQFIASHFNDGALKVMAGLRPDSEEGGRQ